MEIPLGPQIKLRNFLYDLDDKVRIKDKENFLLHFHKSLGKTYKIIASKIRIPQSTYRHYIQGSKNPSIQFLKRLSVLDKNLLEIYFSKDIKFTARKKIITLPKYINPKLAYFIGYLQGDGFIGSDKKTVGFADEYIKHLEFVNKLNKELFGKKGSIRTKFSPQSKKGCPALEIRQYVVNSYLYAVFNIPRGYKNKLRVPKDFYQEKKIMKWYLRGLFDADGTLPKNPEKVKQFFIDLTLKDKAFISEIKKILKNIFGIYSLKLYPRKSKSPSSGKQCITWEIRIRRKDQIKKFLKEVGFYHYHKKDREIRLLKILLG